MTLKVLHVIPSLSPLRGGPSFVVPAMAHGLTQAGVEVHIATTDDDGPDGHLDVLLGQPVVHDGVTCWYFRRQTRFYTASWPLAQWLRQNVRQYDLVHIHALFSCASLLAAFYAYRNGIPYVVRPLGTLTRWGVTQRRPLLKRVSLWLFERHILRHAARVQFTSIQERNESEALGTPMASVLLPLGLEQAFFEPLPASDTFRRAYPALQGKTVILFLARLDAVKGLDLLLPAFAELCRTRPDVALVLAGSGDAEFTEGLRAQVRRLGIEQDVIFTGFLAGEQKMAAFAAADLFVLPSYSENFGVVVVEAMASSVPIIISDRVGLAEDIRQADAGVIVPCQHEALVASMAELIDDPQRRHALAQQGRLLAEQRFSLEAMNRQLLALYHDLTSTSEGKKPHEVSPFL
jgi:glycosyltransferase involved in cell wall biosynthesis